jgi:predicted acetyltransferase
MLSGSNAEASVERAMLRLEEPSERWHGAFVEMAAEFDAHGNSRYVRDARAFPAFLARVRDEREGRGPLPEQVPMSHFWLVRDNQILGSSRLRHVLTAALEQLGGNIGYDIRPSMRRRGLGTSLLRLTLERARAIGLTRVRITCDADNVASIRVIEKNGGTLDAEVFSPERGKLLRQYWIDNPRA